MPSLLANSTVVQKIQDCEKGEAVILHCGLDLEHINLNSMPKEDYRRKS